MFQFLQTWLVSLPRKKLAFWGLMLLPLASVYLPEFQTTFQEDALLTFLGVWLLVLLFENRPCSVSPHLQPILKVITLGMFYGVVWLGLVRGYYDSLGRWLVFYPGMLLAARFYFWEEKEERDDTNPLLRAAQAIAIALLLITFILVILWGRLLIQYYNPYYAFEKHHLPALLLALPIIAIFFLFVKNTEGFATRREILPMALVAGIVLCGIWRGNAETWALWHRAGIAERAWTPFKYDKAEDIAEAERQPYRASNLYFATYQRLEKKGILPDYWNWTFFMKYRMALQGLRKENFAMALQCLPPTELRNNIQIRHAKQLWNEERLWDMQISPSRPFGKHSMWVDLEKSSDGEQAFALDVFGRVYRFNESMVWLAWDPPNDFADAIDLEILNDTFLALRSNGIVETSAPIPFLNGEPFPKSPEQRFVDFEIAPGENGLVAITDFGQMFFLGETPVHFPNWRDLYFGNAAVADIEIDPNGIGYYLLDRFGGIHHNPKDGEASLAFQSPPVVEGTLPYWGKATAVDLEFDAMGRGMYVYTTFGDAHPIAEERYFDAHHPEANYHNRGIGIVSLKNGDVFTLENNGALRQIY